MNREVPEPLTTEELVPGTYDTPQQILLAFAEQTWGPQFGEDDNPKWWCFSEHGGISTGAYAGVTNGEDYYLIRCKPNPNDAEVFDVGIRKILTDGQEALGITETFTDLEDEGKVQKIIFWYPHAE